MQKTVDLGFQCSKSQLQLRIIHYPITSYSNLRRHVKTVHPAILSDFDQKLKNAKEQRSNPFQRTGEPNLKQTKITGRHCTSRAQVNVAVTNFIVSTGQAFTVVHEETFNYLISILDATKKAPCCETLIDMLENRFKSLRESLQSSVLKVDQMALGCDAWSANHKKSFMDFTCSWVEDDFSRRNAVLAVQRLVGSHTYDVLANSIWGIMNENSQVNFTQTHCCFMVLS